jgi:DNA recombination protein RmuC
VEIAVFVVIVVGFLAAIGLQVLLLVKLRRLSSPEARWQQLESRLEAVRQETISSLHKDTTDLATRIAGSSAAVRQDLTDRVSNDFLTVQQRIEAQLSEGRKEQNIRLEEVRGRIGTEFERARAELQSGLQATTTALESKFSQLEKKTEDRLEGIRQAVDLRLEAIGAGVRGELEKNINEGFKHFEAVQTSLKSAEEQLKNVTAVGASITELNNLLRLPHLRGKFGEASLDMLLSDFLPNHLIERNANIEGAGQVEFAVKFPRSKLPIDSKFPREQIAGIFDTNDPAKLMEARKKFAAVLKDEARRISKYIRPDAGTMDMALMFLPSENLFFELIRDEEVCNELFKKRVYPVSRTTLAITLKGIAIANDYYELTQGIEKTIGEVHKAQKHFADFHDRFEEVGKELTRARGAFEKAQTHLGRYSSSVARLTGESAQIPFESHTQLLPPAEARQEQESAQ